MNYLDLLSLGDTGWGDEMLLGALMTILVSLSAMAIGLFFSIFARSS